MDILTSPANLGAKYHVHLEVYEGPLDLLLRLIEREEMRLFADLLARLDEVREGDHTLLDQSAILLGSNLGNASSHNNTNLPIITAGGRMKHAGHLAFTGEEEGKTPPLANLFVSYLHHLGIEADQFATGKGTMPGIEVG